MASRSRSQSQSAPAPAPAPVVLGAVAETEHVLKGAKVYEDVAGVPRVILKDGRVGTVQHEVRADGTRGPQEIAVGLKRADGASAETARRFPLADVQMLSRAFAAQGFTLIDGGVKS